MKKDKVKSILDQALSDAKDNIPSEEITATEMMEILRASQEGDAVTTDMKHLDKLSFNVEVMAGTDIPGNAIPQMVELANRLGCDVTARCNGVKIIALPGDDPKELGDAWYWELGSTHPVKLATVWGYRQRPKLA